MNWLHTICYTSNYILLAISGFSFLFFLFVLVWALLPTHCKCKGLLLRFIILMRARAHTRAHTHTHTHAHTHNDFLHFTIFLLPLSDVQFSISGLYCTKQFTSTSDLQLDNRCWSRPSLPRTLFTRLKNDPNTVNFKRKPREDAPFRL